MLTALKINQKKFDYYLLNTGRVKAEEGLNKVQVV
jgi:hypothetical protein